MTSEHESQPSTSAVKKFVEDKQERAYRNLGKELGLGPDAAKAYAHLAVRQMPLSHLGSKKFEKEIGRTMTPDEKRSFDDAVTGTYRQYFSSPPPTPFEDPNLYPILSMILDEAMEAFRVAGKPLPVKPFVATLPSGQVNAVIMIEPETGTPIIFFEQGLFQILGDFALLVGRALPHLTDEELADDRALARHRGPYTMPFEASQVFAETLYAYVVFGTPPDKRSLPPQSVQNQYLSMLTMVQTRRFVMAHELAHIALGHLDKPSANPDEAWLQEFQADAFALSIMTAASHRTGQSWGLSFLMGNLALLCFHFLDRAIGWMAFGSSPSWISPTHPPALDRRLRLREIVEIGHISHSGSALGKYLLKSAAAWIGFGSIPKFELYRRWPLNAYELEFAAHVTPEKRAAAGELCGMADALLGRLWEIAIAPLMFYHYENTERPSPLWKKHIASCFRPADKI